MYPLYGLLLGILTKVFDDIVDRHQAIEDLTLSTLQSLIIMLYTLVGWNDVYFMYSCLFVIVLNSGFDHPFWNSFLPVTLVLFGVGLSERGDWFLPKLLFSTISVIGILSIAYIEELYFPEEYSLRKIISRVMTLIVFIVWLWVIPVLPLPAFFIVPLEKTLYIMSGYMFTSVVLQTYDILRI